MVGVRVLDQGAWYGEGEVKVYRDGDTRLPDHLRHRAGGLRGQRLGHGRARRALRRRPAGGRRRGGPGGPGDNPEFVGFYRWHLADPIMFARDLRVTIQQIGAAFFAAGQEAELAAYEQTHPVAGDGWHRDPAPGLLAWGIAERVDDYCATSFVYCARAAAVPPVDVAAAVADIGRRRYEVASPFELRGQPGQRGAATGARRDADRPTCRVPAAQPGAIRVTVAAEPATTQTVPSPASVDSAPAPTATVPVTLSVSGRSGRRPGLGSVDPDGALAPDHPGGRCRS